MLINKDFEQQLKRDLTEMFKSKVETVYCLEHDRFARLVIVDEENGELQIEGCCSSLIERAKATLQD